MSLGGQDESLLQDFLTESGELIERLDADLVRLEQEPASKGLLDGIFRAIHTIKGAASFLNLNAVTRFSHSAEDALNRLRKGEVAVDAEIIDALLKSVDVVRGMIGEVGAGQEATLPDGSESLLARLKKISDSAAAEAPGATPPAKPVPASAAEMTVASLPPEKSDLIGGLIAEIDVTVEVLDTFGATRAAEMAAGLLPTARFFEFNYLIQLAESLAHITGAADPDAAAKAERFAVHLRTFGEALKAGRILSALPESDGENDQDPRAEADASANAGAAATPKAQQGAAGKDAAPKEAQNAKHVESAETTVRVEVARLETLLNLVGELVLTKNQVLGMARHLRQHELPHELMENVTGVSGALDRLTSELQVGVMRTRLQPLNKLFGRYPRVVRDLARNTGKQIDIEIVGGETEVDKSVLEQLADPMVHILRNSADHGIEPMDVRVAAGKSAAGRIRVEASHSGGHVRVEISDDGKGIDPAVIGPKAVEKGLITQEELAQMPPERVVALVFAAGFSTAEKVSDLSGRGVGMDVVRTNIEKIGGTVSITSEKGKGTMIEVMIPLTVAIMPAMMVGVGRHQYAIPLACITEIVRLEPASQHSVAGRPVIRIREDVLPLIDLGSRLGEPKGSDAADAARFAVVSAIGQHRAALAVDSLVGQQEIVIKPLDDVYTKGGPFSGATIREDGEVSLIIDAAMLVRQTPASAPAARTAGAANDKPAA